MPHVQGIVLHPSQKSLDQLNSLGLKEFIARPANIWKNLIPHLSLVLYSLPEQKIAEVKEYLEKTSFQFSSVTFYLGPLQKIGSYYLGWRVEDTKVREIHEKIVESLKSNVKGYFNPKYQDQSLSEKEQTYLHEYGYHRIKEFYEPHITIGKYKSEEERDIELLAAPTFDIPITFNKIVFDDSDPELALQATILWERVY